jgi:hypothetical protein
MRYTTSKSHRDAIRPISSWVAEIDEVRALGDFTIARIHTHGHGVTSDAPKEQTVWQVGEWRRGKVIR